MQGDPFEGAGAGSAGGLTAADVAVVFKAFGMDSIFKEFRRELASIQQEMANAKLAFNPANIRASVQSGLDASKFEINHIGVGVAGAASIRADIQKALSAPFTIRTVGGGGGVVVSGPAARRSFSPDYGGVGDATPFRRPFRSRRVAPDSAVADVDAVRVATSDVAQSTVRLTKAASKAITANEESIRSLEAAARRHFFAGATLTGAFTAPAVVAGGAAIGMATGFEERMAKVSALTDTPRQAIAGLSKEVIDLSKVLPQTADQLADSLYFVSSAGFKGAEGVAVLKAAAVGAAGGLGETETVADTVTTVLNAYGKNAYTAAQATDILTQAVVFGKGEAEEYAPALGKVIAQAKLVGVSFEEVSANIATMSRVGISPREGATALNMLLRNIMAPSKEAKKALASMGMAPDAMLQSLHTKGLLGTLQDIMKVTHGDMQAIDALIGSVRGLKSILSTAGAQADTYVEGLRQMENSAGAASRAQREMANTMAVQWKLFKNNINAVLQEVGGVALPGLTKKFKEFTGGIPGMVRSVVEAWRQMPEGAKNLAMIGAAALASVGPLLILRSVFANLQAAILMFSGAAAVMPALRFAPWIAAAIAAVGGIDALTGSFKALQAALDPADYSVLGFSVKLGVLTMAGLQVLKWAGPFAQAFNAIRTAILEATAASLAFGNTQKGLLASSGLKGFFGQSVRLGAKAAPAASAFGSAAADAGTGAAVAGGAVAGVSLAAAGTMAGLLTVAIAAAATEMELYKARVEEAVTAQHNLKMSGEAAFAPLARAAGVLAENPRLSKLVADATQSAKEAGDDPAKIGQAMKQLNDARYQVRIDTTTDRTGKMLAEDLLQQAQRYLDQHKAQLSVDLSLEEGAAESFLQVVNKGLRTGWVNRALMGTGFAILDNLEPAGNALLDAPKYIADKATTAGGVAQNWWQWGMRSQAANGVEQSIGAASARSQNYLKSNPSPFAMPPVNKAATGGVSSFLAGIQQDTRSLAERVNIQTATVKDLEYVVSEYNKRKLPQGEEKAALIAIRTKLAEMRNKAKSQAPASSGGSAAEPDHSAGIQRNNDRIESLRDELSAYKSFQSVLDAVTGKVREFADRTEEARVRNEMHKQALAGISKEYRDQAIAIAQVYDKQKALVEARKGERDLLGGLQSIALGRGTSTAGINALAKQWAKEDNFQGSMRSLQGKGLAISAAAQLGVTSEINSLTSEIKNLTAEIRLWNGKGGGPAPTGTLDGNDHYAGSPKLRPRPASLRRNDAGYPPLTLGAPGLAPMPIPASKMVWSKSRGAKANPALWKGEGLDSFNEPRYDNLPLDENGPFAKYVGKMQPDSGWNQETRAVQAFFLNRENTAAMMKALMAKGQSEAQAKWRIARRANEAMEEAQNGGDEEAYRKAVSAQVYEIEKSIRLLGTEGDPIAAFIDDLNNNHQKWDKAPAWAKRQEWAKVGPMKLQMRRGEEYKTSQIQRDAADAANAQAAGDSYLNQAGTGASLERYQMIIRLEEKRLQIQRELKTYLVYSPSGAKAAERARYIAAETDELRKYNAALRERALAERQAYEDRKASQGNYLALLQSGMRPEEAGRVNAAFEAQHAALRQNLSNPELDKQRGSLGGFVLTFLSHLAAAKSGMNVAEEANRKRVAEAATEYGSTMRDLDLQMATLGDSTGDAARMLQVFDSDLGRVRSSMQNWQMVLGSMQLRQAKGELEYRKQNDLLGKNEVERAGVEREYRFGGEMAGMAEAMTKPGGFLPGLTAILSLAREKQLADQREPVTRGTGFYHDQLKQIRDRNLQLDEELRMLGSTNERQRERIRIETEINRARMEGFVISADQEAEMVAAAERVGSKVQKLKVLDMMKGVTGSAMENLFSGAGRKDFARDRFQESIRYQQQLFDLQDRGYTRGDALYKEAKARHDELMKEFKDHSAIRSFFDELIQGWADAFRKMAAQDLTNALFGSVLGTKGGGGQDTAGGLISAAISAIGGWLGIGKGKGSGYGGPSTNTAGGFFDLNPAVGTNAKSSISSAKDLIPAATGTETLNSAYSAMGLSGKMGKGGTTTGTNASAVYINTGNTSVTSNTCTLSGSFDGAPGYYHNQSGNKAKGGYDGTASGTQTAVRTAEAIGSVKL